VTSLDQEFTRVYEEYTRRVNTVKVMCQEIIQLWAELGTPQAQTDSIIIKHHRDAPEQLGLHKDDMANLKATKDRLVEEKRGRERRLNQLRSTIEDLWDRLGIEMHERKQFLSSNRGCGLRAINEYEDELGRLNELKRQNLHLFVEEARIKLQELWDALFFSEEEMLDFTPAFSDVCSDALLSAHEAEIARLEALKDQRLPTLQKIDRHRELVKERDDLAASSQDASRLMLRGQKGERRDPGKLLREEKMRKRIAKELPKIEAELIKTLEQWEDEYGRPFLVLGERYLDELQVSAPKAPPKALPQVLPPRSKTPSAPPTKQAPKSAPPSRGGSVRGPPPTRAKTPVSNFGASIARNPLASSMSVSTMSGTSGPKSPTKIPSRSPLKNMPQGNNSPERRPQLYEREESTVRKMGPPRAPPPRMKDLFLPPEPAATPVNHFEFNRGEHSDSIVRQVPPEDPYDDRNYTSQSMRVGYTPQYAPPPAPGSRQISQTSSTATGSTMQSGSENWETFSERSEEPEQDVDFYNYRQAAARNKRFTPEGGYASPRGVQGKKIRSIRGVDGDPMTELDDGRMVRVVEGSDAGWTDEDAY
jgi:protein regulator of cytokinesis 1